MKYKHLDRHDRNQIEILLSQGYLQKDIAIVLRVNPSTISREIKRYSCGDGNYVASVAQHKADIRRRNSKFCGMKIEKDDDLKQRIINALESSTVTTSNSSTLWWYITCKYLQMAVFCLWAEILSISM